MLPVGFAAMLDRKHDDGGSKIVEANAVIA
jgi:hypothetical protein